jgi:hypothetical protein
MSIDRGRTRDGRCASDEERFCDDAAAETRARRSAPLAFARSIDVELHEMRESTGPRDLGPDADRWRARAAPRRPLQDGSSAQDTLAPARLTART